MSVAAPSDASSALEVQACSAGEPDPGISAVNVKVSTMNGQQLIFPEVASNTTISSLKSFVSEKLRLPEVCQILCLDSTILTDFQTLSSVGKISSGCLSLTLTVSIESLLAEINDRQLASDARKLEIASCASYLEEAGFPMRDMAAKSLVSQGKMLADRCETKNLQGKMLSDDAARWMGELTSMTDVPEVLHKLLSIVLAAVTGVKAPDNWTDIKAALDEDTFPARLGSITSCSIIGEDTAERMLAFCRDEDAKKLLTLCERAHTDQNVEVEWLDAQFFMEWLSCVRNCYCFEHDYIRPNTEMISKLEELDERECVDLQRLISMKASMEEKIPSTKLTD